MLIRYSLTRLCSIAVLLLPCILCSCAHKATQTEAARGVVQDWNGLIDEVEIVQPFNLNDYSKVLIAGLDTATTPLPPVDENTYKPVKEVLGSASEIFTKAIIDDFREAKAPQQVLGPVKTFGGAGSGALLVRGKVTAMDPGSKAKRYWVGFGAGKSLVQVEGEVVDGPSNKALLRFKHARSSGIGLFGGDYKKFLTDDLHDVGEDVGKMLLHFGGRPFAK